MCISSFNFNARYLNILLNIIFKNIFSSIMKCMITFSGGADYNETIIECVFPAGNISMQQLSKRVDIYDDTIDEDRQFFFIVLEVKSATNKSRVKLTTPITKCNINDNDGEFLYFHFTLTCLKISLCCV